MRRTKRMTLIFRNKSKGTPTPIGENSIYGVSWDKSSSPTLTRTDDSVGFTAEAGVGAGTVVNDFDTAEIYKDITTSVDALGNTFVKIPKFYIKKQMELEATLFKSAGINTVAIIFPIVSGTLIIVLSLIIFMSEHIRPALTDRVG